MAYDLEKNFTYHPPKGTGPRGQQARYEELRAHAKTLAMMILMDCPDSRERSMALTKVEEAVMWSNAAISRNE